MKKAVHINENETLTEIIKEGTLVNPKFQADANVDIKAKGLIIQTATKTAQLSTDAVTDLESKLTTAITQKDLDEANLVVAYNLGVDKANEVYPHDEIKLKALGLVLSKDTGVSLPAPTIVEGGSAVRSTHSGKASMHWHSQTGVRSFSVMETTDLTDLMDESKYYAATPASFINSKGGDVVPKDGTKITWWRVFGINAAGEGVWSVPFGGFAL